ncbi:MAG: homoserine kinase [Clostridia bacterium]|nr:homoserine kinase [Clostridia bacterium]
MIRVKVPATSANLGPGFDSMGLCLGLYNEIEIEETEGGVEIVQDGFNYKNCPIERNLLYKAMKAVFDECGKSPKGLKIKIESNIPATRGLGSSAACIIGGMVGANAMYGLLGPNDILSLATKMERHPDNVTPCLMGGFTVSCFDGERVTYSKMNLGDEISLAVIYPDSKLSTGKARTTLPYKVSHRDAAYNAAHSALLVSAIAGKKYNLLAEAMKDKLHQPYRMKMIPDMEEIFKIYKEAGAYGAYLSGSGPTLAAIIPTKEKESFSKEVCEKLSGKNYNFDIFGFDNMGTYVRKL